VLLQIEEEAYQDDLGLSLGTLGKSTSGRVRGPLIDSKTKARISKTLQVISTPGHVHYHLTRVEAFVLSISVKHPRVDYLYLYRTAGNTLLK